MPIPVPGKKFSMDGYPSLSYADGEIYLALYNREADKLANSPLWRNTANAIGHKNFHDHLEPLVDALFLARKHVPNWTEYYKVNESSERITYDPRTVYQTLVVAPNIQPIAQGDGDPGLISETTDEKYHCPDCGQPRWDHLAADGTHKPCKAPTLAVGAQVRAGLAQAGGAGYAGKVSKIEGNSVWVELGGYKSDDERGAFEKYGPRTIKVPRKNVRLESTLFVEVEQENLNEAKANWKEVDFMHETRELLLNSAFGNPPCWCRALYSKGNKHTEWCQKLQQGFKGLEAAIKAVN